MEGHRPGSKMKAASAALNILKKLHRTCRVVFDGDAVALKAARDRIRYEFRANRDEKDPAKIEELLKHAEDVEMLLRTTVVQLEFDEQQKRCKMKLRKDLAYQKSEIPVSGNSPDSCQ
ncbi:unnamed protein product [Calicophoron daubneyi]|uniref:Complex III assembly factor LYRM7 n=1 Tax=Calicophoron daubneyi TaxID=300641 RepID=A0AAV2TV13_CALDB